MTGVSPQLAMTRMDDKQHPECDLYVEDISSQVFLNEILMYRAPHLFMRCEIVPYGASSLGMALGEMVANNRFRNPTCVFLDGDNDIAPGCVVLPGNDAPERVVFADLRKKAWVNLWTRVLRTSSDVSDACESAMLLGDHHEWVGYAATKLRVSGSSLWQSMCAEWAHLTAVENVKPVIDAVDDAIG